jgi:molybdopterin synthase catalytic subunit
MAKELQEGDYYVALTHDCLDAKAMMDRVRSPKAGAIVLFAGYETGSVDRRLC